MICGTWHEGRLAFGEDSWVGMYRIGTQRAWFPFWDWGGWRRKRDSSPAVAGSLRKIAQGRQDDGAGRHGERQLASLGGNRACGFAF